MSERFEMANPSDELCLDSNVIIDLLDKTDRYHHIAPILKEAESGRLAFILSVIAKSEVLSVGSETTAESNRIIGAFFRRPYVHIYGVSELTADITADVRRRIGLDTPDAIHLATAIEREVPILLTRDGALLEANSIMNVEIITPK